MSEAVAPEAATPPVSGEPASTRRLALHALGLALVLVLGMLWVGDGSFSADEGAAIVQAEDLADGEPWIRPHSFPEADPEGEWYPLHLGLIGERGVAPFGKHPLYASLLAVGSAIGGWYLMAAWSTVATLAAAVMAARLTSRLEPRLELLALWTVGLGTPLLFDSYLLIAHALAAALAAGMALLGLRSIERRHLGVEAVGLAVLAGLATMLRTESILFVGAFAVGALVAAGGRRGLGPAAAAAVGGLSGYVLNEVWQRALVGGGGPVNPPSGVRGGSFLADRFEAFLTTWLRPHYTTDTEGQLLALGVVALAAGVLTVRLGRGRVGGALAVVGGLAVVVGVLGQPSNPVPGLLIACPLLVVGALGADRLPWTTPTARLLGVTVGLYFAAVLATQYRTGGSGEWGGRYFAMGLPLLVPLALVGVDRVVTAARSEDRRAVVGALVAASLALAIGSVETMRTYHDRQAEFARSLEEVTAVDPGDGGLPVVIATGGYVPRMAYPFLDERRWLLVDAAEPGYEESLAEVAATLDDLGIEGWTLVTGVDDEVGPATVAASAEVGEPVDGLPSGRWVARPVTS